jgi:hypothetical protein
MAAADETGARIATARKTPLTAHLPRRARRKLTDRIPWPLLGGSLPLLGILVWLLRRPHPRPPEETA